MTNPFVVLFAQAVCIQSELEAMKVENEQRRRRNETPAYGEDKFYALSFRLEQLIYEARGASQ